MIYRMIVFGHRKCSGGTKDMGLMGQEGKRGREKGRGREKRRKEGAPPLPLVQFGLGLGGRGLPWAAPLSLP